MLGFNFGKLGNVWDFLHRAALDYDTAIIVVTDADGNPIVGAKVEIVRQTVLFFSYTDENGEVVVHGKNGEHYTLIISGEKIETTEISDWTFGNATIQVKEKKFLEIRPEYIWLTPQNFFTDDVEVTSNVDWIIV